MKVKTTRRLLCLTVILFWVAIFGCSPRPYNKRYFILNANRPDKAVGASQASDAILEVRRFMVDRAFDSKNLVYRKGEYEYESDFYNEFLVSPAEMMTEKTRLWLSNSGLFTRVSGLSGSVTPTHILEGNVVALYGDYTDQSSPLAVMEINVFLMDDTAEQNRIVLGKTYSASIGVDSPGPEGLIEAFDRGLETILSQLEDDLAGKI